MFKYLEESGYGCKLNGDYFCILGYADDIVLMAPDKMTLYKMLDICVEYADTHCLTFNASKFVDL